MSKSDDIFWLARTPRFTTLSLEEAIQAAVNRIVRDDMSAFAFNRPTPWQAGSLEETGGYDCMTSAVSILDKCGRCVAVIDARDYLPPDNYDDEDARRDADRAIVAVANLIVDSVNRASGCLG